MLFCFLLLDPPTSLKGLRPKNKKHNLGGSNKETCGSHQGGKRIALNKTAAMKAIQQEGRVVFIFLHNVESWANVGVFKECGNL